MKYAVLTSYLFLTNGIILINPHFALNITFLVVVKDWLIKMNELFDNKLLKKVYAKQIETMLSTPSIFIGIFNEGDPYTASLYKEQSRIRKAEAEQRLARKWSILLGSNNITVKALCELHTPNDYNECNGCDTGMYAESGIEWPCRTIELLFELLTNE